MPRTSRAPRTTTVELTDGDMLTIIESLAEDRAAEDAHVGESLAISGKLPRARRAARSARVRRAARSATTPRTKP